MDEHMKARLIGATVLVVLAVVLVPELLSGPKSDAGGPTAAAARNGMRSYTIELGSTGPSAAHLEPTATETPAARTVPTPLPTVSPPGERAAPTNMAKGTTEPPMTVSSNAPVAPAATAPASKPVATTSTKVASAATPAAVPTAAAATPVPLAAPPPATKGSWAVQVGAFSSSASAHKLVTDLGQSGFKAYVAPLNRSGKTLYRVRVGPAPSKPDAEKLAARLKSRGTTGSVVPAG
jgi:cell division septation protein DedD